MPPNTRLAERLSSPCKANEERKMKMAYHVMGMACHGDGSHGEQREIASTSFLFSILTPPGETSTSNFASSREHVIT